MSNQKDVYVDSTDTSPSNSNSNSQWVSSPIESPKLAPNITSLKKQMASVNGRSSKRQSIEFLKLNSVNDSLLGIFIFIKIYLHC